MPTPIPVGSEIPVEEIQSGEPTGQIFFLGLPEPTYLALSDIAARHGMTLAQAISQAVSDFCKKTVS